MADLDTSGFQLQELPGRINIPDTITHFDVGAVYDRVKQGLDNAEEMRRNAAAAFQQPSQMQAGVNANALSAAQSKAGLQVLPFATGAAISQDQLAQGQAQMGQRLIPDTEAAQRAQLGATKETATNEAQYLQRFRDEGGPGNAAVASGKQAGAAAAAPGGVAIAPVQIGGGVQSQAPLANQDAAPTRAVQRPPSAAAATPGASGAQSTLPAQAPAQASAPQQPVTAAPVSAQPAQPPAQPLASGGGVGGGLPIGAMITKIGPNGAPESSFAEMPLAAMMRTPISSSLVRVGTDSDGSALVDRMNTMANGAQIFEGSPHKASPDTPWPGGQNPGAGGAAGGPAGAPGSPVGQPAGTGSAPAPAAGSVPSLPQSVKANPEAIVSPGSCALVAAPAPQPVINTAGQPLTVQNKMIEDAQRSYQSRVENWQKSCQEQIKTNTQQMESSDAMQKQLNEAFDAASTNFGVPHGLFQISRTAQNAAKIFSPEYQAASAYAINQFAKNIPKGLNRVTQLEWSNLISASINPGNAVATNRELKANIEAVLQRNNELDQGYSEYVSNSPQQIDNGWASLESRYLKDNPLTDQSYTKMGWGKAEQGQTVTANDYRRVPFPTYTQLLAAGETQPNAYVQKNGIPDDKALVAAARGEAPLPVAGQNGYDGGRGMVVNRTAPLPPAAVAAGTTTINGYTFKVLSPTQMVMIGTPANAH